MSNVIHAVFEHGVFRPIEPVDLPESTHVVEDRSASSPGTGVIPQPRAQRSGALGDVSERTVSALKGRDPAPPNDQ